MIARPPGQAGAMQPRGVSRGADLRVPLLRRQRARREGEGPPWRDLGYESVFLDFDPTGGLVPGQAWRDQLFTNLDACDAVVFITTPKSNASQWCHSELALTRWLRKPILALLVDGCAPHPLTADLQGLHVTSDAIDPDQVRSALTALGLDQEARWDASRSPYPGLRAFDESYAAVFFGRDRQIDQLRQLVDPPEPQPGGRHHPGARSVRQRQVLAGPGRSGAGAPGHAGLGDHRAVDAVGRAAGRDVAGARARRQAERRRPRRGPLPGAAHQPGGMADYVRELREAGQGSADTKVLVVVDQAEELVTMTPAVERQAFLEALTTSCTAPSPLRVVMTARTDMWDKVAAETGRFAMSVAPTVLHVPPLSRTDLAEVISEPARRSHLTLEDGLVQRLVDDTGSGDALPLLAFTLARLATDAEPTAGSPTRSTTRSAASRARSRPAPVRSRSVAAPRSRWPRRSCTWSTSPTRPHTSGWPAPSTCRRPHREILDDLVDARLVVINEVNDQQVYAPAHESLVLGLAAAGRADRSPPRRPRAARTAGAPRRRLARGWRHPVRAAVRPGARPGTRLATAQRATSRPPTWRRTSTRRRPASAAAE